MDEAVHDRAGLLVARQEAMLRDEDFLEVKQLGAKAFRPQ